ncbi:uncharacterized protein Pyn_39112 [Prunus yedoensis var. nudiflora]|uniref:Uncharacterized protein n=1 Tax=Prunus yedoensis var. nudiflora TaxID=2094558 RepID=A0A314Z9C9_PRUYE|nr:uncharacterized protein Pyn_39112 [Prunus yedoensis var. nudiflora]
MTITATSPPVASAIMSLITEPSTEGDLVVITSSPLPIAPVNVLMPQMPLAQESTVVTELAVVEAFVVPPAAEVRARPSEDLAELYGSLHEKGGSSTSAALLNEDSMTAIERLRDFLHMGVHQMTNAEIFSEFRSCLDTAMALGLLNST